MNKEIKEALDYIEDRIIPNEKWKEVRDYITNLQEENQKLKELCDKYEEEHNNEFKIWKDERHNLLDYKSRNEKAIELINIYSKYPTYYLTGNIVKELLNILTGGDKE